MTLTFLVVLSVISASVCTTGCVSQRPHPAQDILVAPQRPQINPNSRPGPIIYW